MRIAFLLTIVLLSGCVHHHETARSRDRLNCEYHARYDPGIPAHIRAEILKGCRP